MGNGRIFFDRVLLAERKPGEVQPKPNLEAIQKVFPDTTADMLDAKVQEAKEAKERARRSA